MMKRKIFETMKLAAICVVTIALIGFFAALFSGAGANETEIYSNKDFEGFVVLSEQVISTASKGEYMVTMYDSQTYVMYVATYGGSFGNVSPVTPLYNADGTLRIYDIPVEDW